MDLLLLIFRIIGIADVIKISIPSYVWRHLHHSANASFINALNSSSTDCIPESDREAPPSCKERVHREAPSQCCECWKSGGSALDPSYLHSRGQLQEGLCSGWRVYQEWIPEFYHRSQLSCEKCIHISKVLLIGMSQKSRSFQFLCSPIISLPLALWLADPLLTFYDVLLLYSG